MVIQLSKKGHLWIKDTKSKRCSELRLHYKTYYQALKLERWIHIFTVECSKLTRNATGKFVRELMYEHVVDVLFQGTKDDDWTSIASRFKGHRLVGRHEFPIWANGSHDHHFIVTWPLRQLTSALFLVPRRVVGLLDEGEFARELETAAESASCLLLWRRPGLESGRGIGMGTRLGRSLTLCSSSWGCSFLLVNWTFLGPVRVRRSILYNQTRHCCNTEHWWDLHCIYYYQVISPIQTKDPR